MGVLELTDEIELLISEKPDRRKKKEYQDWVKLVNEKINIVNAVANYKLYGIIK